MRKFVSLITASLFQLLWTQSSAQSLYFPPATGTWQTLSPASLGWCDQRIDSLYEYLRVKNTKSFLILKDGKIVLEKYFGTYTLDSVFYWASASKSLASFLAGIAKTKNLINLNAPVSLYLGTGWSSAPLAKENLVTVLDVLRMTSGFEDYPAPPCGNEDSAKACLTYKVDAGSRWAYHTGAYKKIQSLVSAASGLNYNVLTTQWLKNKIGMGGVWFDQTYYSKARDMARFGLLNLAKGIWQSDTILPDTSYFAAMTRSSQLMNPAYGYLWWLNGKSFYLNPGSQFPFPGPILPNAPADLYAALGKNDQKIYVVPSTQMVIVRQGNSAENVTFALSGFDNKLWDYINKLSCNTNGLTTTSKGDVPHLWPNPAYTHLQVSSKDYEHAILINTNGQVISLPVLDGNIEVSGLSAGLYQVIALDNVTLSPAFRFVKAEN